MFDGRTMTLDPLSGNDSGQFPRHPGQPIAQLVITQAVKKGISAPSYLARPSGRRRHLRHTVDHWKAKGTFGTSAREQKDEIWLRGCYIER